MHTYSSELVSLALGARSLRSIARQANRSGATHLKGWNFVNVVLQNDTVLASCQGEIFCLDPFTGNALWHNPLKGFGTGLATIAGDSNQVSASAAVLSEKRRRDQAA